MKKIDKTQFKRVIFSVLLTLKDVNAIDESSSVSNNLSSSVENFDLAFSFCLKNGYISKLNDRCWLTVQGIEEADRLKVVLFGNEPLQEKEEK